MVTVIGLSAGGGVAQYLLQEHPERVEHAVFSHCGILERDAEAEKATRRLLTLARLLPLWAIRRQVLKRTAGQIPPTSAWIAFHNAYFQEATGRFTKEMFLRFLQSGAQARQRFVFQPDAVESWPGQALLLASRDDEMAAAGLEKLRARYPGASVHLFDEGGHHTFMLFPQAYTAALRGFLEGAKTAASFARILVYGTGPLGSLFAARLQQGGNDVSILARGQRLADLREHGIVLVDVLTGERTVMRVNVVESLAPDDAYDLVLVIMRKNHALQILPVLAANRHTPNVLFLMNNAAGPEALVEALGQERVLIGFPGSAGYREGVAMHVLTGSEDDKAAVPFGEVDGRITERTHEVARILERAPGFQAEIRTDMDAWLKYHVALLFPSLAPTLYAAGVDNYRLARTRDLVVLALRAMREGFRVLQAKGLPVTPPKLRVIQWLPEPILVLVAQRLLSNPLMETALVKHAEAARSEVQHLIDEFMALAHTTSVPTPTIDRLLRYYEPGAPEVPDGSAEIPLRWGGLLLAAGALAAVVTSGVLLGRRLVGGKRS